MGGIISAFSCGLVERKGLCFRRLSAGFRVVFVYVEDSSVNGRMAFLIWLNWAVSKYFSNSMDEICNMLVSEIFKVMDIV